MNSVPDIEITKILERRRPTLRSYFVTGFLALLPLLITVVVVRALWNFTSALVDPVMERLLTLLLTPQAVSGLMAWYVPTILGIVVFLGLILLMGLAIQLLFGKALVGMLDSLLGHIPVVSGIYQGVRQMTSAFDPASSGGLRQVVLIRPIRGGAHMIGFLTRKVTVKGGKKMALVYVPTNTMYTGDVYLVGEREFTPLDIPVEDGVKLLVSGGLVAPERLAGK
jgi:uncharacterized membrane protein